MARIEISELWCTQNNLKRFKTISKLMNDIIDNGLKKAVELHIDGDKIVIDNGHHRVAALYLAERFYLEDGEFILIEKEQPRKCFSKLIDLVDRLRL